MRPSARRSRTLVFAATFGILLAGCGESSEADFQDPAPSTSIPPPPDEPSEAELARAIELGSPAADALAQGLVGRLTQAIDQEGIVGALEFCSDEAMPLTEQIQAGHDDRLDLKRTTLRWRNPVNAPDASEQRILEYLDELEALDPTSVPAELAARGPDGTLRYYRVLRAGAMCLNCHGDEASLEPEVLVLLQDRYPDDLAIGYEVGALRGVIRVDIPPLQ